MGSDFGTVSPEFLGAELLLVKIGCYRSIVFPDGILIFGSGNGKAILFGEGHRRESASNEGNRGEDEKSLFAIDLHLFLLCMASSAWKSLHNESTPTRKKWALLWFHFSARNSRQESASKKTVKI